MALLFDEFSGTGDLDGHTPDTPVSSIVWTTVAASPVLVGDAAVFGSAGSSTPAEARYGNSYNSGPAILAQLYYAAEWVWNSGAAPSAGAFESALQLMFGSYSASDPSQGYEARVRLQNVSGLELTLVGVGPQSNGEDPSVPVTVAPNTDYPGTLIVSSTGTQLSFLGQTLNTTWDTGSPVDLAFSGVFIYGTRGGSLPWLRVGVTPEGPPGPPPDPTAFWTNFVYSREVI